MEREVPIEIAIAAEKKKRQRQQRRELGAMYDFYGDECACGVPLGTCKVHYRARPAQRPPGSYRALTHYQPSGYAEPLPIDRDDWEVWLLEAGRGFGKTWTGAVFVTMKVLRREWQRIALVNETVKDVRDVQILGDGGLIEVAPPWCKPLYEPSKASVRWFDEDGEELAEAIIYSAEAPRALRGPQFHGAWCDELAKWEYRQQETWDMLQFGMRLGDRPQIVVTTTPQPTATYLDVRKDSGTVITGGSTDENRAQLAPSFVKTVVRKFEGTRLGQQELHAAVLLDATGALWNTGLLESTRATDLVTIPGYPRPIPRGIEFVRIVVGVDPSAGAQDPETSAECGIVVIGRAANGHGYILDDRTIKGTPGEWAEAALRAYEDWRADCIVAERNNGGAMVEHTIRNAKLDGRPVGDTAPLKTVWATHGKMTRAEPVAMLFEQGRMHMVGVFPALEAQMTSWVPDTKQLSPDRLDAMVWAGHETMVEWFDQGHAVALGRRIEYPDMPTWGI